MQEPLFNQFNLVGGTALALQMGHRMSIDLDLFSDSAYDFVKISQYLQSLGQVVENSRSEIFYGIFVNDLKIDFLHYPYKQILETVEIDGIRMLSKLEIAGMKLAAISHRATKKDYVDLYFLLKEFSIKQMLEVFHAKYPIQSNFHVLKALGYFEDAEKSDYPQMLQKVSWEEVKAGIIKHIQAFEF